MSTVIVQCRKSLSNGTVVRHKEKFYVCTTAHGVIDKDNVNNLKGVVTLTLDPVSANIPLVWTECYHSAPLHRLKDERQHDVCAFLIDPTNVANMG